MRLETTKLQKPPDEGPSAPEQDYLTEHMVEILKYVSNKLRNMHKPLITEPGIMLLQTLLCANRFSSVSFGDSASLATVDELAAALVKHEITYELVAYVHVANVIRAAPRHELFVLCQATHPHPNPSCIPPCRMNYKCS